SRSSRPFAAARLYRQRRPARRTLRRAGGASGQTRRVTRWPKQKPEPLKGLGLFLLPGVRGLLVQFSPALHQRLELAVHLLQRRKHLGRLGGRTLIESRVSDFRLNRRDLLLLGIDLARQSLQLALQLVTELLLRNRRGLLHRRRGGDRLDNRRVQIGLAGFAFGHAQQTRRTALTQPVLIATDELTHLALAFEDQR